MDSPADPQPVGCNPAREEEPSAAYLRTLERLATALLRADFGGSYGLWQIQLDLLKVQRDIQRAITELKPRAKREKSLRPDLTALREARWHARHLGDAYAWLLLGLDRRVIYPLALNQPVPIPPDDHGNRGMVAAAEGLANSGWGFPLLHDITDILRIGDITFIKPDDKRRFRTVEVKTQLNDELSVDDGKVQYDYTVTLLVAGEDLPDGELAPAHDVPSDEDASRPPRRRAKTRALRQVERLDAARARQQLRPGTVGRVGGESVISVLAEVQHAGHWDVVRRVARRARRTGYASEAVEEAFVYAAMYNPDRIDPKADDDNFRQVALDLAASNILFRERPERNSLVVYSIPHAQDAAHLHLPYYLYPLPRSTIIDMLHGRMVLFNLVNSGKVVDALETRGFEVSLPHERNDLGNGSLIASAAFVADDGGEYRADLHNLGLTLNEMVMEFQAIDYFIAAAEAMREGARMALDDRQRKQGDEGVGA
jgi:hypothetical protein